MRRAAKVDANQSAIVQALRQVGASILHLHTLGRGVPDLLVAKHDRMWLMELKDGDKSPSKRKLTPDEVKWIDAWPGPVYVVESVEDAIAIVTGEG